LEGQEQALGGPLFRLQLQQLLVVQPGSAASHLVAVASGQHVGQGALAGAVGAHDGVHLARPYLQVDAFEDLFVVDGGL